MTVGDPAYTMTIYTKLQYLVSKTVTLYDERKTCKRKRGRTWKELEENSDINIFLAKAIYSSE